MTAVNASECGTSGTSYKYWAFISYSHADAGWAEWLHRALESYRIPRRLRRPGGVLEELPRRLYPVFRDREELPSAANLSLKISEALADSRFLIVICSPRSAVSRWVNQEIQSFQEQGRSSQVLCLIVDGEPHADRQLGQLECFAPSLLRDEPLAADVRAGKDSRIAAKLKLIAGII
jgi:eukaryotic-like serine/threonine-protein kinase